MAVEPPPRARPAVRRPRGDARSASDGRRVISLLEADPDLGAELLGGELPLAKAALMCQVVELEAGAWPGVYPGVAADSVRLGAMIVEGLVFREMTVAERSSGELLGPGDILLPVGSDESIFVDRISRWRALAPTTIAILGETVSAGAIRWPSVGRIVAQRSERRVNRVLAMQALAHLQRAADRLLGILWLLAERWGRIRGEDTIVTLPLTRRTLGQLAGVHRQSATAALKELEGAGRLSREQGGTIVLHGHPPPLLAAGALGAPSGRRDHTEDDALG